MIMHSQILLVDATGTAVFTLAHFAFGFLFCFVSERMKDNVKERKDNSMK